MSPGDALWYKGAMNVRILAIAILATFLAACQPAEEEPLPDHAAPGILTGSAFYFERISMPEDTSLELALIDTSGPVDRVLTRMVFDDVGNPPYPFELEYDPAGVDPADSHELWLTLYMPDGSARFSAEASVDLSHREVQQIRLIALEPESETVVEEEVDSAPEAMDSDEPNGKKVDEPTEKELDEHADLSIVNDWQCGDIRIEIVVDEADAVLTLPWQDRVLRKQEITSGSRFTGGGITFSSRGPEQARLELPGQAAIQCRPSSLPSPWALARDAGAYFRATGNEPGWVLELYDRDGPVLRLELDGGARELLFDTVIEDPDGDGYIAEAPGNQAGIILIRETCRDSMVGWEFPYRVEMLLNDRELSACGRYL
jgi:putative lipoprotein